MEQENSCVLFYTLCYHSSFYNETVLLTQLQERGKEGREEGGSERENRKFTNSRRENLLAIKKRIGITSEVLCLNKKCQK